MLIPLFTSIILTSAALLLSCQKASVDSDSVPQKDEDLAEGSDNQADDSDAVEKQVADTIESIDSIEKDDILALVDKIDAQIDANGEYKNQKAADFDPAEHSEAIKEMIGEIDDLLETIDAIEEYEAKKSPGESTLDEKDLKTLVESKIELIALKQRLLAANDKLEKVLDPSKKISTSNKTQNSNTSNDSTGEQSAEEEQEVVIVYPTSFDYPALLNSYSVGAGVDIDPDIDLNLVDSFAISPGLSGGLSLDSSTGKISGTLNAPFTVSYSVSATLSNAEVIAANITIASMEGVANNPQNLQAHKDDASNIVLTWDSGGGTTADYIIAYVQGSTAPVDCASDNIIAAESINESIREHSVGPLTANTEYSFRVCAINANAIPDVSSGVTATQTTHLACDYNSSDAASSSFADFQTLLDAATDQNADGKITVCMADGDLITTSQSSEGDAILLPANSNLYAPYGASARFYNQRTDGSGGGAVLLHSALSANGDGIMLYNLEVETDGVLANGVNIDNHDGIYLENLLAINNASGTSAAGIKLRGNIELVKDVTIELTNGASYGISITNGGTIVKSLNNVLVKISSGGSIGLRLGPGSIVEAIDGLTIRRLASAVGNGNAIVGSNAGTGYFKGENIQNILVCSDSGADLWEAHSTDGHRGLLYDDMGSVAPSAYNAWDSGSYYGIQTFPFTDLDTPDQGLSNIVLGGLCP